jgi:xanthine dehydrogenase large subunit
MAAQNAANTIKQRLAAFAADAGAAARRRGRLRRRPCRGGDRDLPFGELVPRGLWARISLSATGYYDAEDPYDRAPHRGRPFYLFRLWRGGVRGGRSTR